LTEWYPTVRRGCAAAKVKLVNEKTHDTRETITNNDGYYTFIGMAVGDFSYGLTVEAKAS